MGYDFFVVRKPDAAIGYEPELPDRPDWFRFSWRGMRAVFEAMRLAAILEDRTPQPNLPARTAETANQLESLCATASCTDDAVPYWKFTSNAGWLVLPAECKIIADRLILTLEKEPEILRPQDWPTERPLDGYYQLLREWAAFNLLASTHGGYKVK